MDTISLINLRTFVVPLVLLRQLYELNVFCSDVSVGFDVFKDGKRHGYGAYLQVKQFPPQQ